MLKRQYRIFLVDDHPLVRQWLGQLIEDQENLVICGEASSLREARMRLAEAKPDMAILDISLPDGTALDLIKTIKSSYPNLPMLVLSMHDERTYAERSIRAGACGYIMKRETSDRIMDSIYAVLRGKLAVSESIAALLSKKYGDKQVPPSGPHVERLSNRELEIFELIGAGIETRNIAKKLQISIKTVQTHCAKVKEKLELESATELLREAIRWNDRERGHSASGALLH